MGREYFYYPIIHYFIAQLSKRRSFYKDIAISHATGLTSVRSNLGPHHSSAAIAVSRLQIAPVVHLIPHRATAIYRRGADPNRTGKVSILENWRVLEKDFCLQTTPIVWD